MWEKAYVRARRFISREYPTQRTLKRLIGQFDAVREWKAEA